MAGQPINVSRAPNRPSIRDVARRAGVSAGCVSNVLNHRRRQDDPIGRAVLSAVAELGYRRNAMAANLRRADSRFVGVVLPDFENPFFGALLSSLERCAEKSGYRLTPACSREDPEIEAREVAELLGWRVAGLLVAPTLGSVPGALAAAGVPRVVVDRLVGDPLADEVAADNRTGARLVTERLIALGHREILVAVTDHNVLNIAERLAGAEEAVAKSGQPVCLTPLVCGWSLETADAVFESYLANHPMPSSIFALHNLAALAAYSAAMRRGCVPGRGIALASFDDSAWMSHMHPAVAAVAQPIDAIARAAWERLLARIDGAEGPAERLYIPCRLIERETLVAPAVA